MSCLHGSMIGIRPDTIEAMAFAPFLTGLLMHSCDFLSETKCRDSRAALKDDTQTGISRLNKRMNLWLRKQLIF